MDEGHSTSVRHSLGVRLECGCGSCSRKMSETTAPSAASPPETSTADRPSHTAHAYPATALGGLPSTAGRTQQLSAERLLRSTNRT
eukprot:850035-Pleurochrysis_carterae.AAC.1